MRATDKQHGGDHYIEYGIQPVEFIHANNVPFIEGCVIKYILRHRRKNGKEDLLKARHFIDILLELEYEDRPEDSRGADPGA